MSIQTELSRIINAKAAIKAAIDDKGVAVPDATLLDGMAALIESIDAGGGVSLADVDVYVADFYADEVAVTAGALDVYKRIIIS